MTDFLVERCLETLDSASCQYRATASRVVCECENPSEFVEQAFRELALIRWCGSVFGADNSISRVLADEYATHPEYRPEWHRVA